MNIFLESLIVGLITAIVGFLITTLFMFIRNKDFSFEKYNFWHYVFFSYFLTGMIIHLVFYYSKWSTPMTFPKEFDF
jgi:hypothetical protein